MKSINSYKIFTLHLVLVMVTSCIQDGEFDVPTQQMEIVDIDPVDIITIGALRDLLVQEMNNNGNEVLTFNDEDPDNNRYISGYVISSDEGGNFFEELILQDAAIKPSAGVKVLADMNPLFTTYEFGRKVYVKLDGLTVGLDSGVLTLGVCDGNKVAKIAESQVFNFITRDPEVADITPLELQIGDFNEELTNLFVRLNDVQFNRTEVLGDDPKTFAAEITDEFNGERLLESCADGARVVFSTSVFADFKALLLPIGRGSLEGILTYNFFGDMLNIVVNDPTSINFDNEDRCDPNVFVCTTPGGGGEGLYNENFEDFNTIEDYEDAGWTNVNVSGGTIKWDLGSFSGNNYMQISGFNTGEATIEAWLVSPEINMDATIGEELLLDIEAAYDNQAILTVWASTNFTGDFNTADWLLLDVIIPIGPQDAFGGFKNIGPINISCLEGSIHLAFFYKGSDPNATTRYHIDNIKIIGN